MYDCIPTVYCEYGIFALSRINDLMYDASGTRLACMMACGSERRLEKGNRDGIRNDLESEEGNGM